MLGEKGVMSFQSALAFSRRTVLFLVGIYSSLSARGALC